MLHETASATVVLGSQSVQSYTQNFKQFRQSCDTVMQSVSTEWLMLLLKSIQVNKHLQKKRMTILLNVSYYSFCALRTELQMISVPMISGSLPLWHDASSGCELRNGLQHGGGWTRCRQLPTIKSGIVTKQKHVPRTWAGMSV